LRHNTGISKKVPEKEMMEAAAKDPARDAAASKDLLLNRRRRLASLTRSREAEEACLGKIAMAALSWNSGSPAAVSLR
jgi:hypothetical protein